MEERLSPGRQIFEESLSRQMFNDKNEKTYIDKVTSKDEILALRELIKKDKLSKEDISQVFNLLVGVQSKLVNYTDQERYVILKYHIWVREFVKHGYQIISTNDETEKKTTITETHRRLLERNQQVIQSMIKFLIEVYQNISNTSLSVKGKALDKILSQSYEIVYPNERAPQQVEQKNWLGFKKGG